MDSTALLVGYFEHLASQGVCAWNPSGIYTSSQTAAVLESLPDAPDRAIALLTYPALQPGGGDEVVEMQMLTRGTKHPQTVNDLHDAAFGVLNGLGGRFIGGVWVVDTKLRSATSLPPDGNGRRRRSTRFFVTLSHDEALDF